jgi:catalase
VSLENTVYSAKTRKVAILVDDGCDYMALNKVMEALKEAGVMSEVVSKRQGMLKSEDGQEVKIDMSYPTTASVLYDAVYIPGGEKCVQALMKQADALQFVKEMYVHYKTIAASGQALDLLQEADIKVEEGSGRDGKVSNRLGVVTMRNGNDMGSFCDTFVEAIARDRHWGRMDEDMWQASERPYTLDM